MQNKPTPQTNVHKTTISVDISTEDVKTQTDWRSRFAQEFGNPNLVDSSSQFHPKHKGKLYGNLETFIANERKLWLEEVKILVQTLRTNRFEGVDDIENGYNEALENLLTALEKLEEND